MNRISATVQITVGLVSLSISILLAAAMLGVAPNHHRDVMQGRVALAEAIAIQGSLMVLDERAEDLASALEAIARRNADIRSAGIRRDGELLVEVGDHALTWESGSRSNDSHVLVPIMRGDQLWGTVEICFQPLSLPGLAGWVKDPFVRYVTCVALLNLVIYYFYLRKMLQHLDPSRVIPDRVRVALDTLAEGLLVLDKNERIVLANKAFATTVGKEPTRLQGMHVSALPWRESEAGEAAAAAYPWKQAILHMEATSGAMVTLNDGAQSERTFKVNSAPILGDDGQCRGVLASFDDVTLLERRRAELLSMLEMLKRSREELHRQNEELHRLATLDPMTSCLNRRAFFEKFETHWDAARRQQAPLSCVMVDVDHFKSINDDHGHSVGDEVLRGVAAVLRESVGQRGLVCRFGGEEFCVLLPETTVDAAAREAERWRQALEQTEFPHVRVTASLGVSAINFGAESSQQLLDQADKCLYVAKRNGRNCVIRWDQVPSEELQAASRPEHRAPAAADTHVAIPFHAVTALVSALTYRDTATAEHSRRVADLCAAMSHGLMSASEAYVLEMAALLHDIGKIGVPDSILLKPGPLNEAEWKVMRVHDRIGVEILRSTFASPELARIVETHHAWFGGHPEKTDLPIGRDIPLAARILAIVDAYDAIVSDRVYRKGRSQQEAVAELRRCAGVQFDPELVERFIAMVQSRDESRLAPLSSVSKQVALRIGEQIERLALALDNRDFFGLAALAGRLRATATQNAVPQIAEVAARLESAAAEQKELSQLIELTGELLDLCRSTQRAYFHDETVQALRCAE